MIRNLLKDNSNQMQIYTVWPMSWKDDRWMSYLPKVKHSSQTWYFLQVFFETKHRAHTCSQHHFLIKCAKKKAKNHEHLYK